MSELHPAMQTFMDRQQGKADNTIKARRAGLKRYNGWLADQDLDPTDVTSEHIDQYFSEMQGAGYAPSSIKNHWGTVHVFCKFLSLRDDIEENPMDAEELRRRDYTNSKQRGHIESKEPNYITKEELEELVAHAPPPRLRNKLLIRLMFQTGVRTNEVTRIRLSDIDRDDRSIDIYSKKTGETRTVFYQPSLDFLLEEWLDGGYRHALPTSHDSQYLFVSRETERLSEAMVNPIVSEAADEAGIQEDLFETKNGHTRKRVTPHTLRHSHAVHALKSGIDVRTVQKHLGHASLEMTMQYLDLIDDDVKDAYQADFGSTV